MEIKKTNVLTLPKAVIMMTPNPVLSKDDKLPFLEKIFWERFAAVPKDMIFVTVVFTKEPYEEKRWEFIKFYKDVDHGSISSIIIKYGFMEEARVEQVLMELAEQKQIPISIDKREWFVHIVQERTFVEKELSFKNLILRIKHKIFSFIHKNSDTADHYLGLGRKVNLSIESVPVPIIE